MYAFKIALVFILLLSGCSDQKQLSPVENKTEAHLWKLVTAWPPNLPVNHEVTEEFAKDIELMSNGKLKVKVFNAGELIPGLQVFDAVSQGAVQMGFAASYYWSGKIPASQIFTVVPFGMTEKGSLAWIKFGGGLKLWLFLPATRARANDHRSAAPAGTVRRVLPAGRAGEEYQNGNPVRVLF